MSRPGALAGAPGAILIARLDAIGDVVLTTAFLRELRRSSPRSRITLVVQPPLVDLLAGCPHVDEIVGFAPRLGPAPVRPWVQAAGAWSFLRRQRLAGRFDLAIDPRWDRDYPGSRFVVGLSGAQRRVGYGSGVAAGKRRKHPLHDLWFTDVCPSVGVRHEVERSFDLLRFLGMDVVREDLELWISDSERQWAEGWRMERAAGRGGPLVGLVPGAVAARRRWPAERFAEIARWLRDEHDCPIVLFGSPAERPVAEAVASLAGGGAVVAGEASLRETAALIDRCSLVVSNDTAPVHLAAALGTPVVTLSCHPLGGAEAHANSPTRFRPWTRDAIVLQPPASSPCRVACEAPEAHCIRGISVAEVREAIGSLWTD